MALTRTRVQRPQMPGVVVAALVVAVLGVLGHDGVRVALLHLRSGDDAQAVAQVAAAAVHERHDTDAAYAAAVAAAQSRGDTVAPTQFTVAADGTVHLVLQAATTTVVLGRVLPAWQRASASADARWVP